MRVRPDKMPGGRGGGSEDRQVKLHLREGVIDIHQTLPLPLCFQITDLPGRVMNNATETMST